METVTLMKRIWKNSMWMVTATSMQATWINWTKTVTVISTMMIYEKFKGKGNNLYTVTLTEMVISMRKT